MSIQDDEYWWWCVHMHVYARVCVSVIYFCAYNLGSLYVSTYTDFTRPVSECLNSGHLNQKAFCYS